MKDVSLKGLWDHPDNVIVYDDFTIHCVFELSHEPDDGWLSSFLKVERTFTHPMKKGMVEFPNPGFIGISLKKKDISAVVNMLKDIIAKANKEYRRRLAEIEELDAKEQRKEERKRVEKDEVRALISEQF